MKSTGSHIVYLIACLLVVAGLIMIGWRGRGLPGEWGPDIAREFGHALIIAGLLASTVDFYVKKHLVHAIQKDTAHYLIGFNMPATMQIKIGDLIRTPFIRRNMVVRIELKPSSIAPNQRFNVHYDISYDVVNVSNQSVKFQPYIESEEHNKPDDIQIQCTSSQRFTKTTTLPPDHGVVRAQNSPEKIPPDGVRGFQISYSNQNPIEYSDPILFAYPTEGLKISISCPADIETTASECPFPPTIMQDAMSERTKSVWAYGDTKVFLTGEAVIIRWWRKKHPDQASSHAG